MKDLLILKYLYSCTITLQFDAVENGIQISKLMQIFSKQAPMIDALIAHFSEHMRKRKLEGNSSDQFHDGNYSQAQTHKLF